MALKINAVYDPGFSPIVKYIEAYERDVQNAPHKRVAISVERNKGYVRTLEMDVFNDGVDDERNGLAVERIVKTFLWSGPSDRTNA